MAARPQATAMAGGGGGFSRFKRDTAASVVSTLLIMSLATGTALALIHALQLQGVLVIFLAAVLIVALVFGLPYGLAAAAAAFFAYHTLTGAPYGAVDTQSADTVLLALFGVGVVITGLYTDVVRRRAQKAGPLLEASRPISSQASGPAIEEFLDVAQHAESQGGRASLVGRPQIYMLSAGVLTAGLAVGAMAWPYVGSAVSHLTVAAAVATVAGLLGARFGLAAGVLAVPAIKAVAASPLRPEFGSVVQLSLSLVLFAGLGWGVGALADKLRRERGALSALMVTGRDLSSGSGEAAVRQVLVDGLARVRPGALVRLGDESGANWLASPGAEDAHADPRQGLAWRTKGLAADGRDVGVVHWWYPGAGAEVGVADEVAAALSDLAASAIVRARLSAEKAEMEFMARTEHLRTILLDAVSHHFRSPLAGILGSVTSILNLPEQHDREARRELLLIIKEQANRLNRYVDNFLGVARVESGSIDVDLVELDVEPLIYDVWESFGEAGGARRFLHVQVDRTLVLTDRNLLSQVLGNVLENAIKFSPEGSVVDVRSIRDGAHLLLQVTDQGKGVPEASLSRIFDRFYRSQGAIAPGLGLGLYITRSLITIMGGEVTASNRSDGESGFQITISLPLGGKVDE